MSESYNELQEEYRKQGRKEFRYLLVGVVVFVLMIPVDYILIQKFIEYRQDKQKPSNVIPDNKILPGEIVLPSGDRSYSPKKSQDLVLHNRVIEGSLEVDGKRYLLIDGKFVEESKK